MRLLAGFAFVFVSIAFVQGQLVVPQFNNLNPLISLIPQFQGFFGQLDKILPQLASVLSSVDLQSLKGKITQVVLNELEGNLDLHAIKDKLRPVLQQFLGSEPQARIDFDVVLQQITNAATSSLPGIIVGLLGKREATDARDGLNDILALADKLQLQTIIPQVKQFLSPDKLQELQKQLFATVLTGVSNNWDLATLAQALQQLVTGSAPQVAQMRIDWDSLGQSLLEGVVKVLPGAILSILGKREATDARAGLGDILALVDKLQLQTIIPQVKQFLSPDKLQELQKQLFSTVLTGVSNNWDLATLAQAIQQLVTGSAPQVAQMRIDWEKLGQTLLEGAVKVLPGAVLSILGKREATDARAGLNDILALADKLQLQTIIPQVKQFLSPDKLQELQKQLFATVVTAVSNNWDLTTLAQALEQLVTQSAPQVAQMRINWEKIGLAALQSLPGVAISLVGFIGKRSLGANYQQLLAQLPVDKLAQIVEVVIRGDKATRFAELRKLLQSFFVGYQGRINFDDLAANVLNHLNSLLPTLSGALSNLLG